MMSKLEPYREMEIAKLLNSLSDLDIMTMKENSHRVAMNYSNSQNEKVMQDILVDLNIRKEHSLNPAT